MARVTFLEQRCKGCGFCVEFCPKKVLALGDGINNLGYHYVVMKDLSQCNACAFCAMVCPDLIIEVMEA